LAHVREAIVVFPHAVLWQILEKYCRWIYLERQDQRKFIQDKIAEIIETFTYEKKANWNY
jgi:hypothetical protein